MTRVLLVEDDAAIRDGIELVLRRHGHEVDVAATGEEALALLGDATGNAVDLAILDVMLPGIDGFELCHHLHHELGLPVIMLTARGEDSDVVRGLQAGADDYVVKPVTGSVLEARIRAVLRRAEPSSGAAQEDHAGLCIDRASLSVSKAGSSIPLPPVELRLLLELSAAPRQVFSREQLLRLVWDLDYLGDSRLVDAAVGRLRSKIEDVPSRPRYVQTVRGFGYRFGPT